MKSFFKCGVRKIRSFLIKMTNYYSNPCDKGDGKSCYWYYQLVIRLMDPKSSVDYLALAKKNDHVEWAFNKKIRFLRNLTKDKNYKKLVNQYLKNWRKMKTLLTAAFAITLMTSFTGCSSYSRRSVVGRSNVK